MRGTGIADSSICDSHYVTWRGVVGRAWCARLEISEETATAALDRVPDMEAWPDFEVTAGGGEGQIGLATGRPAQSIAHARLGRDGLICCARTTEEEGSERLQDKGAS